MRFVSRSGIISRVSGTGIAGLSGDGGLVLRGALVLDPFFMLLPRYAIYRPASLASLNSPMAVLPDGSSGVYIADTANNALRRVLANGTIVRVAGNGTATYCGDGGASSSACLSRPSSLASDGFGGVLVADSGNSIVRRVLTNGTIITVAGTPLKSAYSGDGGPASLASSGTICGMTGLG